MTKLSARTAALLALLPGVKVHASWQCPLVIPPYADCGQVMPEGYCAGTDEYTMWTECAAWCWQNESEPVDMWCDDSESENVFGCRCYFTS